MCIRDRYTLGRLEGVRNALWLMVGTSIDHGITYEVCVRFGREVLVAKAAPTNLHPKPGLTFQWCRLPSPLNLTLAEASLHGLTALAFQRDASRYATHLSELQALLRVSVLPTFKIFRPAAPAFRAASTAVFESFRHSSLRERRACTSARVASTARKSN